MKIKKRRKSSRYRGSQTAHRGAKERTRGSGNQGGKGMAGTGKRADQKKSLVIHLYGNSYFGKDKTLRRGKTAPKPSAINLRDIEQHLNGWLKKGIAKESKGAYEIGLAEYKILGEGELSKKCIIKAKAASSSAKEKVKKAGGEILLPSNSK